MHLEKNAGMARVELDGYYLDKAKETSNESPCFRSKVGAIIVKGGEIIARGFNKAPPNQKSCAEIGNCYRDGNGIKSGEDLDKCRAFGCHAEGTAIAKAAEIGAATRGSTMYIHGNTEICPACRGSIANAGIAMVVYRSKHGDVECIDVGYDWSINRLDQPRKFKEWKEVVGKGNGTAVPSNL